jgi:carboxymethylenebutenolidase
MAREIRRQCHARYVKARPDSTGRLGATGFCFGGGVVNNLAVQLGPDLHAAVPFYGGAPRAEDVPKIKAALLINYAEDDERINAAWPAYEAALKANRISYEKCTYPGTQHGFHNDTTRASTRKRRRWHGSARSTTSTST